MCTLSPLYSVLCGGASQSNKIKKIKCMNIRMEEAKLSLLADVIVYVKAIKDLQIN